MQFHLKCLNAIFFWGGGGAPGNLQRIGTFGTEKFGTKKFWHHKKKVAHLQIFQRPAQRTKKKNNIVMRTEKFQVHWFELKVSSHYISKTKIFKV